MGERKAPERADFSNPEHAGYFGDHAARYLRAARWAADRCVVDVACGSGYGTAMLRQFGAARSLGLDANESVVDRNREKYGRMGVEFLVADCQTFDFASLCPDVVVSFETIEHLSDPEAFVGAVGRALRGDGLFFVSCPNDEQLGNNPYHLHAWDTDGFHRLLARYFGDVIVLGQVPNPSAMASAEFGRYLDFRIGVLWNQLWTRVWRAVRQLLGRPPVPARPEWCNILPGPYDWWFVPDHGPNAISLVAMCRSPRFPRNHNT